ncbi:MAG: di-heme oxidoredictase family protein, partial [Pseudomonadota bacterium]|nr:di-heme oxidoredictase family protein [Pseudomonadota bacterium]
QVVNPQSGFLHDGRARTLEEAILWHGGEAQPAADRYRQMAEPERSALIDFLNSL